MSFKLISVQEEESLYPSYLPLLLLTISFIKEKHWVFFRCWKIWRILQALQFSRKTLKVKQKCALWFLTDTVLIYSRCSWCHRLITSTWPTSFKIWFKKPHLRCNIHWFTSRDMRSLLSVDWTVRQVFMQIYTCQKLLDICLAFRAWYLCWTQHNDECLEWDSGDVIAVCHTKHIEIYIDSCQTLLIITSSSSNFAPNYPWKLMDKVVMNAFLTIELQGHSSKDRRTTNYLFIIIFVRIKNEKKFLRDVPNYTRVHIVI